MATHFDYTEQELYPPTDKSAHLRADGNLTYLSLIDIITRLWNKAHPDAPIVPLGNKDAITSQMGYIVYGTTFKRPTKSFPKPRHRERIKDSASGKDVDVYMQIFDQVIFFTALHKNPRVAEEILEAFEGFMLYITDVLKREGLGDIFYYRRPADREETKSGEDMAMRTVEYLVQIQKIETVFTQILEEIHIDVRTWMSNYRNEAPPVNITGTITTDIVDQYLATATPNY